MSRPDNVQQLALDRSAADFSSAGSIAAATLDATAQAARVDCLNIQTIDVIIEVSTLGSLSEITVVGRTASSADPDVAVPGDWQTINTEALNTGTGVSTITPYIAETSISATGSYIVTFPVRGRYFSALVWGATPTGSRGQVFTFRRGNE